ncbi:MAG: hypothetical protein K2I21_04760, partial [Acetatifactor sp.]|nr:hypothetical protein [Acetatifactor sp.]
MVKKNIGLIHRLAPAYIPIALAAMLLDRAVPFVEIILGARIVDMLAAGAAFTDILTYALIMVGTVFLLSIVSNILQCLKSIRRVQIYDTKNIVLADKTMAMDYDILEKNSTQELMSKAENSAESAGGLDGYAQAVLQLAGNVISVAAAIVTMGGLFVTSQAAGEGILFSFFSSPLSTVCLLTVMGIGVYASSRYEARKGDIRYKADMANVDSSRIYWYFYDLMFKYPAGKDIRIFRMGDIIQDKGRNAMSEVDSAKKEAMRGILKEDLRLFALEYGFTLCAYLFAGLKAILGIISIGELTRYVSTLLLLQGQV